MLNEGRDYLRRRPFHLFDHIRWYGDAVKPLSPKGGELVGMCKLWRFGVAKAGVQVAPPNPLVDGLIGVMMGPSGRPFDQGSRYRRV